MHDRLQQIEEHMAFVERATETLEEQLREANIRAAAIERRLAAIEALLGRLTADDVPDDRPG